MKLYLAGPMTGYPEFNFPAFAEAAATLRAANYVVWSPHESDLEQEWAASAGDSYDPAAGSTGGGSPGVALRFFLRRDLVAVLDSDAVAVLDGWQASVGARVETYVAFSVGIPVHAYSEGVGIDLSKPLSKYEHPHYTKPS